MCVQSVSNFLAGIFCSNKIDIEGYRENNRASPVEGYGSQQLTPAGTRISPTCLPKHSRMPTTLSLRTGAGGLLSQVTEEEGWGHPGTCPRSHNLQTTDKPCAAQKSI